MLHSAAIINGYKEVKKAWETVAVVASEMDGKVFNKRFVEAVCARLGAAVSCFVHDPYNTGKKLEIYLRDRSYMDGSFCVYFDKYIYFNTRSLEDFLTDGRIDASKTAAAVADMVGAIEGKVNEWADAAKNYDKHEKRVRKALAAFNTAIQGVNPLFKMYELHAYNWEHASTYEIYTKK